MRNLASAVIFVACLAWLAVGSLATAHGDKIRDVAWIAVVGALISFVAAILPDDLDSDE